MQIACFLPFEKEPFNQCFYSCFVLFFLGGRLHTRTKVPKTTSPEGLSIETLVLFARSNANNHWFIAWGLLSPAWDAIFTSTRCSGNKLESCCSQQLLWWQRKETRRTNQEKARTRAFPERLQGKFLNKLWRGEQPTPKLAQSHCVEGKYMCHFWKLLTPVRLDSFSLGARGGSAKHNSLYYHCGAEL